MAPLRSLLDPIAALIKTAAQIAGEDVEAVIAQSGWDGRGDLEDAVRKRLGNDCDVLVFTAKEFTSLAAAHEPVVDKILGDGIPLVKNGAT